MDALLIAKIPWVDSEELRFLFRCLSASPNSHSTYVHMLQDKIDSQPTQLQQQLQSNGNAGGLSPVALVEVDVG